jgi:hypothetical protein
MSFSRFFVMFVVLPLLFIAGIQLFILSEHTDFYFAWTIALPLTAAFMGAGYWAALIAAYLALRQAASTWVRLTGPTAVAATFLLGIATFLHLDKFHLTSPALLTRFVTWVWVIVYVVAPLYFLVLLIRQGRDVDDTMGAHPIPSWIRAGYLFQAALGLLSGIPLFLIPGVSSPFWPWALTPLTARAVSAWLIAYGLACLAVNRENDLPNTNGTRASLLAFCLLQFVALARYFSSFDLTKPVAWIYLLFLLVGVFIGAAGLFNRPK